MKAITLWLQQGKSKEVIDSYLGMGQSVTDYSNIVATEQQKAGQRYVDAVLALANYRASHKGELTTLEQERLRSFSRRLRTQKRKLMRSALISLTVLSKELTGKSTI